MTRVPGGVASARRCVRSSRDARRWRSYYLQVVVRVFVRDPGPGRRLAEAVVGLPGPAPPVRRRDRPRSGGVRLRAGGARPRRRPRAGVAGTACGWRRRHAARRGPRRVRGGARATRVRSGGRIAARCADGRPPPASRAMSIAVSAAFTALGAANAQAQFGVRHRQGHRRGQRQRRRRRRRELPTDRQLPGAGADAAGPAPRSVRAG